MKKVMTIFGAMFIASLILTSCGSENKSEDKTTDLQDLQGKYFKRLDGDAAIYFISDNELIRSYVSEDDVYSIKYKYSLKGNELTLNNKDKSDPEDKDDKYVIYNNQVIMYFFDEEYDYPKGVSYRLSE
jgi:hypothetical protein